MKSVNLLFLTLLTTLFLQGCIANNPSKGRKTISSPVKSTTTNPTSEPTFQSDESMYWFTSQKVPGTITLNKNTDNIIYLRGNLVHQFLVSMDAANLPYYQNGKQFCVIANYGAGNKQLRLRAVPISISNYTTKSLERLFRVDIPSAQENKATCGTASANGYNGAPVTAASAAYSLPEICPGCLGLSQINSTSLSLFESDLQKGTLTELPSTKINLSSVGLRVDLQSNSTSPESSCTNSTCEAKGFDCCIEGQCVKDASEKASAKTNMSEYNQAMSEYAKNPLSFINFPNIFNICSNITHNPPPVETEGPTPIATAEERVKLYIDDYKCIDKFLTDGTYSLCLPSKSATSDTDYLAIKKKLATACGCPAEYSDRDRELKCPEWGIRPLYRSKVETIANIVDFYCYTPEPENPIGVITNLNVSVSNRSAPHRFYTNAKVITNALTKISTCEFPASGNFSYDDISKLPGCAKQEGKDFYYEDELNKIGPVTDPFNFNSLLGRMNVGLSTTHPAKMVNVELGKTYILTSVSGYFTPCSQCAKDSWFQTFSAHPATTGGSGLRASGFTTSRDTYSSNTTLGNYEDTKFGRACYLPATMIPFSHKKEVSPIGQRQNRLETQAAFFINGYQRDWYGFNKGALIGSFDGVNWFAVGNGRRVTATTAKLYLAINASFLDLVNRTDTVVNIIPDLSSNVAADYDYDPTLEITDPKQNTAGSCQQYHQCSTDTDCVTQLGWEYTCADVSQLKSRWPVYDSDAKEVANAEKVGTIFEILQGTTTQGESTKRCVYRGAGAPCVRDFTVMNGKINQKALTCAPNFFCAGLTTGYFNDQVARSPNDLDEILFGMDANILGRPLNYVTANKTLPVQVVTNIRSNGASDALGLTAAEMADMGICRPGRSLSSNAAIAHSNQDTSKRTDYISQVASCNSGAVGNDRTVSCPAFGDDLNYLPYNSVVPAPSLYKAIQNSCGGESKHTSTFVSAFSNIEGGSLTLLKFISEPKLAADACFRRAGSVCHTDLDCSPNKMHEEAVDALSLSYFGGTEAEQNYWRESLICGQGQAVPRPGSSDYYDYKLSENRCCREVGKDFTMYTSGPSTLVPENGLVNAALDTKKFSTFNPTASNRYSRYSVSKTAQTTPLAIPSVAAGTLPEKNQWKVINETGSQNCCGGGWIRKFSDGTHDWKVRNRLTIDTSNFTCLNFRSPLASSEYNSFVADQISQASYQRDFEYFCKFPGENGCMQVLFPEINGFNLIPPRRYEPSDNVTLMPVPVPTAQPAWATSLTLAKPSAGYTRLDTGPIGDLASGNYYFNLNQDVPYQPTAYRFTGYNHDLYTDADGSKRPLPFFIDKVLDYGVSLYLPAYIQFTPPHSTPSIGRVYIRYYFQDGRQAIVDITANRDDSKCADIIGHTDSNKQPVSQFGTVDGERWCVISNSTTQNRPVINVKAYSGVIPPAAPGDNLDDHRFQHRLWSYAAVIIDFQPLEVRKSLPVATPGSMYYYLTKLGRLELTGIPQITYEPIYCNNDQRNLLPGIFSSSIKTRDNFEAISSTYPGSYDPIKNYDEGTTTQQDNVAEYGNPDKRFVFQDKLAHAPVFSSKDFACCTPLGKETTSASKCCSGTAVANGDKQYCMLPSGTNLNVYFNKFVSSEGVGDSQPGGGLIVNATADEESDFNEYTGEPRMRDKTYQRLEALGAEYCESGVVGNGGAFAQFPPEPYSGYASINGREIVYPLSIVDSIIDSNEENAGKYVFDSGFRWDHHYYCK